MRRRERLIGFFIIFVLLTFSAYSNSMNVGGNLNAFSNQNIVESINTEENSRENNNGQSSSLSENKSEDREQLNAQLEIDNSQSRDKANQVKEVKSLTEEIKVHTVKSGETLWDIARNYSLNIDSLIGANKISNMNNIQPGQEFKILPVRGILYQVSPGESINSISEQFDINTETIRKDNNIADGEDLRVDQKLVLRGAKPELTYQDRLDEKLMFPINTRITSPYGPRWGRMHYGVDFAAPMGSPIRAASSGRVVFSGWSGGYGKVIIIEHRKGLRTLYAHNSQLLVSERQTVDRGQVIARSGNTGNSTGPHLHFEVQINGRAENPMDYLHR
ncbi:peptidoglycan DD-metalloendopeptidase family protein [Halanaerobium sp. Z-7514]|uniref:Peptidoglycan DD-metalloendopeptidase family protein n=1 Tax=Halanaerobium polyolivorans TaxID=2886943 RepID=A0AAW4WWM5_9FIRM|nr:M23 family metallopeptidase [Halanaerobium polyolivorans]MCC3144188.1 peptidoglycan DD-metalloendopeptidase family protein [Halanaerobium polyolivorans]